MEVIHIFIYPDNLKAKATLWLWELRDVAVIGLGFLLSVLALASWGTLLPLVLTVLYAFVSIRMEDISILDFLRYAVCFLLLRQQYYSLSDTRVEEAAVRRRAWSTRREERDCRKRAQ